MPTIDVKLEKAVCEAEARGYRRGSEALEGYQRELRETRHMLAAVLAAVGEPVRVQKYTLMAAELLTIHRTDDATKDEIVLSCTRPPNE
jgi:hypothetical protein